MSAQNKQNIQIAILKQNIGAENNKQYKNQCMSLRWYVAKSVYMFCIHNKTKKENPITNLKITALG